jgi:hypothetical protein
MLLLKAEVDSSLDSYLPPQMEEVRRDGSVNGVIAVSRRSWRFEFLALSAERTPCIF